MINDYNRYHEIIILVRKIDGEEYYVKNLLPFPKQYSKTMLDNTIERMKDELIKNGVFNLIKED